MMTTHRNQHGFVMVAAIFLLVVLAALSAFIVSFSNVQHFTSAQDFQGSRAYWAARAGMEWAVGKITPSPDCNNPPQDSFSVEGFTVTVEATCDLYTDGTPKKVFKITSTASSSGNVGSLGHIERSVSATAEF